MSVRNQNAVRALRNAADVIEGLPGDCEIIGLSDSLIAPDGNIRIHVTALPVSDAMTVKLKHRYCETYPYERIVRLASGIELFELCESMPDAG